VKRIYVLGDIMADIHAVVASPLRIGSDTPGVITFLSGGSAANTAAWLAHSGAPTTLIAKVGDDPAGREELRRLRTFGVDVAAAIDSDVPTGACIALVHPVEGGLDRTMIPNPGANANLRADELPSFAGGGQLYVSGYALFHGARDAARAALQRAREAGLQVSVGAASACPLDDLGAETFFGWIGADVLVLANHEEAEVLGGSSVPGTAAAAIAGRTGRAIVTCGADGAFWADQDGVIFVPSHDPGAIVADPVGAGDAFAAGILRTIAVEGPPVEALQVAHQLAVRSIALPGGRP
jgi:sugar/nucleoside kinase (ribokinase family)